MAFEFSAPTPPRSWLLMLGVLLAACAMLLAPTSSRAAIRTFGSPLAVPATLNTADDLSYTGSNVPLPGWVFHVPHDGADTALWNTGLASGAASAPASGQVVSVRLEGCARQPAGAPPPLTQIHFQDLVAKPGGGVTVNVTTQAFDVPVCGQHGASGSTVTTYTPTNFCVAGGDYVDFADEGGFVPSNSGPPPYPSGVPYMVIGSVGGSVMNSFIRHNGVGNGATFSPGDTTYHDGFASNPNEEVMLQATLATGSDATPLCPGGTHGAHHRTARALPPIRISPQTEAINRSRVVSVAIYCRPIGGCKGVATLSAPAGSARVVRGRAVAYGSATFSIRGNKTAHVRIRVNREVIRMLRAHRSGLHATLVVIVAGHTFARTIGLAL